MSLAMNIFSVGSSLIKKRMLDSVGSSLLKRRLDSVGSSLIKKDMEVSPLNHTIPSASFFAWVVVFVLSFQCGEIKHMKKALESAQNRRGSAVNAQCQCSVIRLMIGECNMKSQRKYQSNGSLAFPIPSPRSRFC